MDQLSIWRDENPTVKLHNPIIFGQMSAMDITAMRLFILMMAKWDVNAPSEDIIRVHFKELIPKYSGSGGTDYKIISNSIIELKEKIKDIKIEEKKNGERTFKIMSVLDYLEFSETKDYIEGRFALKIRDYLRQLKGNYSLAELKEIFSLRSYYAIKLYLIGKSFFEGMPEIKLSLQEFRLIVGCDQESYKQFKFLKREVINKSLAALKNTTAAIEIKEKKSGKNVVSLIIRPDKTLKTKAELSSSHFPPPVVISF